MMTTPSKPEAGLRELAAAEAVLCRRLHTGTVEGSTRETAAEMLDAALSARDEAGCGPHGTGEYCEECDPATPPASGEAGAVAWECRVILRDGGFGEWHKCSREQHDHIRLTGHYNGPCGAPCETRALFATPPAASGDDALAELLDLADRSLELADRLIASGPKAAHVSASETHEISEWVAAAVPIIRRLAAVAPPASGEAGADCAHKFVGNGHLCIRCGHDFATPPAASGDEWVLELIDRLKSYAVNFNTFTLADAGKVDEARDLIARRLAAVAPAGMVLVPRQTVEVAIKRLRLGVESPQTADLLADHLYLATAATPPATAGKE